MTGTSNTFAIRTESLVRDFPKVRALDRLTLDVPTGIVFGLLGPNGAGKTTAIRTLLGLLDPTAGRAEVLGFDTRTEGDRIRERTGALLEHPGLYERLSAEDNLEFYGRVWGMTSAERKSRVRELLSQVGLWDRRSEPVGRWSRGMKQKLAVARAVFHRPQLIFLDEPTAGFDPVASAALREDLAHLATREGVTIVLTTHNLAEAERLCQLVGVIRQGRLVALGAPSSLRAGSGPMQVEIVAGALTELTIEMLRCDPNVASVDAANGVLSLTLRTEASTAPLVRLLVEQGVDVEEVRKLRPSFEDAFLDLVGEGGVSGSTS